MRLERRKLPKSRASPLTMILFLLAGTLGFYSGLLVGRTASSLSSSTPKSTEYMNMIEEKVQEEVKRITQQYAAPVGIGSKTSTGDNEQPRFPSTLSRIANGMAVVSRDDFVQHFDTGVPVDPTEKGNEQVLILYNTPESLPTSSADAQYQSTVPELPVDEAVQNCDVMHLTLTNQRNNPVRRQCTAFMGNYESLHMYNFMRLPRDKVSPVDPQLPLRVVTRGAQLNGRLSHKPTPKEKTLEYWKILTTYLKNFDTSLQDLSPIAAKAAVNNTLIVMMVNLGQAELLLNFLCSARARNMDLSSGLLVFATDPETRDIVASMGVNVFYDATNFEDGEGGISLPKNAAVRYADATFRRMMLAKVFCVQMPLMLGYNVLFQDVDLVWFRNPLEYLSDRDDDFDIYFQDDGNHAEYYAPYSANTGFYYVKNSEKTVHLFNSLLMQGGEILNSRSHQIPLIALLTEHASLYGLRVKIFSRDTDEFPGGHAFNFRFPFMRKFFAGTVKPYIFHMSWTHSKGIKIKYFQQMGEWYVEQSCVDKMNNEALAVSFAFSPQTCCLAEPKVTCHYRDKPSKIPCRESPSIDQTQRSFW